LIVVEATCVTPTGRLAPSQLGLWEDSQIEGHRKIAEACHKHGAVVLVQIHHGGYNTHPECGPSRGPSSVSWRDRTTEALSHEEIILIRDQFIEAAKRAKMAGYDGVQLHACHAYLINQFVSPRVNQRTDEYGGSTENRARFGCEIISGIRKACGSEFIISARTTGAEPTIEEAWAVADAYIAAGVDYLQVSSGIGPEEIHYPEGLPYNNIVWYGTQMHSHVCGQVPVSVVNSILTPELAKLLIEEELTDTIDSARALLADPNWARAIIEGTEYVKCRSCKVCLWSPHMPHKCPAVAERHKTNPNCVDYSEA
jgi:2,4-dienoyl-CoA reductase-like NADH-dependent reductase (Old Yellow Enzyme family)